MTRSLVFAATAVLLGGLLSAPAVGQARMIQPMPSPRGTTSQVVGVTQIQVDYGRPGVKSRNIFGNPQIVPFDAAQPWRAGADENTVVSFEHDVTVQGKPLAAGDYGLHMFPKSDGPWTVVFSHNSTAWGSYSYNAAEDALRVEVNPQEGTFQEWLEYEFQDLSKNGATLVLRWETTELPLSLGVKTDDVIVAYLRDDFLRGYGFWTSQNFTQAATYCDQNNVNLQEAESWAARAASATPSFANYWTQASIQDKLGKSDAALASRSQAEPFANETQRNTIGYQLLQSGAVEKAMKVFETNLAQFPSSWNAHDSLAEACLSTGDKARAAELYGKALELVSDDANKARIQDVLKGLEG